MIIEYLLIFHVFCSPSDIPPSPPSNPNLSDEHTYWTLSQDFYQVSEKYRSCLVEKVEIQGKLREYEEGFQNIRTCY